MAQRTGFALSKLVCVNCREQNSHFELLTCERLPAGSGNKVAMCKAHNPVLKKFTKNELFGALLVSLYEPFPNLMIDIFSNPTNKALHQ